MSAERLLRELGGGPVALDTVAFIYFMEEHADYLPLLEPVFASVAAGERGVVTSAITLLEVLVVPYRAGDLSLAARYTDLLTQSQGVRLVGIDESQLCTAAQLRARHAVRTPDALQVAAALSTGCETFVTNDRRLPRVSGLRTLQLRDYVSP